MSGELIVFPIAPSLPVPAVVQGPPQAERRFWEFFTTQINNDNTRKAYFNAVRHFSAWCQARKIGKLCQVEPMHIASHESPRTTKLYDRRQDEISLDEIERIAI
jgi:hypothetical protein